jgi:signal transduction histidine kinase
LEKDILMTRYCQKKHIPEKWNHFLDHLDEIPDDITLVIGQISSRNKSLKILQTNSVSPYANSGFPVIPLSNGFTRKILSSSTSIIHNTISQNHFLHKNYGISRYWALPIRYPDLSIFGLVAAVSHCPESHFPSSSLKNLRVILEQNLEISLLKQEKERLKAYHDELKNWPLVIASELGEPLRMVSRYLKLFFKKTKKSRPSDPDFQEYFEYLNNTSSEIRKRINVLLSLSRIEYRKNRFRKISLTKAVKKACESLENMIRESGASIQCSEHLPVIRGNMELITELFKHLLQNALQYRKLNTPPEIHICEESSELHQCRISVRDNGIGIDKHEKEWIFQPFKKLQTQLKPGEGVGLTLCHKIMNLHAGSIWVESEPGKGSRFYLQFPHQ